MEEIILKLLVTDTEVIQQATAKLHEAFKNPNSTLELYQLVVSSTNPEVRQYSALLLRKRYNKAKHWTALPVQLKTELKGKLLETLVHEPVKLVRNNIAQLIGVIVKHELPQNNWPEVFQFIHQLLSSGDLLQQEMAMFTLSVMTEIAPNIYLPHVQTIMEMLNQTLNSFSNPANPVSCYILDILLNLVPLIEGNQILVNAYHQMLPRIMQVIGALIEVDQEKAIKGFELLDELCETASTVISPHVIRLVEMCTTIANNKSLDDELRVKAIVFIGWLAKTKKKAIVKNKLVEPIIDMLFAQMCTKPDDENQEVYFGAEDENTPVTSATQTLDMLGLHLPPEKLVPYLLKYVEPGLQSNDPYIKKASYLSLAVLAEGCAECIRTKYLEPFLRCICAGISDPQPVVRNAALFALGQFSEHLQPDISRYADELLPVLLQRLSELCTEIRQKRKEPASSDRLFYALEMFAENLNENLLPYLPQLMSTLFEVLTDNNSPVHISELALSAIGSVANASGENMLPYFQQTITILERYLTMDSSTVEHDAMCLQVQAVDTLGVLARTIGPANFAPLAMKSLEFTLTLLKGTEDPDLKKSIYGLLASISIVMKSEMGFVLQEVIDFLIDSVQSSEGIVTHLNDEDEYLKYDDLSDNEADEEDIENTDNENDDDDITGYHVENAYIEEKEEAILALRELAEHTELAFLPYLERSFKEVFKLLNFPHQDIRKAAVDAISQFCVSFSKIDGQEGRQQMQQALSTYVPKLAEIIRCDEERDVVIEACDAFAYILENLKSEVVVREGHKDAIYNCVEEVMLDRIACQDNDEVGNDADDDNEGEAEHDELLFESAGQVFINLGQSIAQEDFAVHFHKILPLLIKRLKSKSTSDSQKSYCLGMILECLPLLKDKVAMYALDLLPICYKFTNDSCDEVRSNAIFGLGELAFHGKEIIYPHYIEILQTLSNAISKEKHSGARDNIIGALARLIITNDSLVPLEHVFPTFVNQLPLKEDLEENKTVYKCIMVLYAKGHEILKPHIKHLLEVSLELLENKSTDDETKRMVAEFMKLVQKDFLDIWNEFGKQLDQKRTENLQQIFM